MKNIDLITTKYKQLEGVLNERSRRVWAASEAMAIGHGGISKVMKATGLSRNAIKHGISDLNGESDSDESTGRIRRKGGGRKKLEDLDDTLLKELDALISPETRGDPESPFDGRLRVHESSQMSLKREAFQLAMKK